MNQHIGYISKIVSDRGFGFIATIDSSKDFFFHARGVDNLFSFDELREGDVVNFDVEVGPKGLAATNVIRGFILRSDDVAARFDDFAASLTETVAFTTPHFEQCVWVAKKLDDKLIAYYGKNPEKLCEINADFFEELYAEFLKRDGYTVERVGSWNTADGGVDLVGIQTVGTASLKVAVQCKHSKNRVSAEPVRSLNGVLDRFGAHIGIVATTSFFTKPAIEEVKQHFFRITLEDYEVIQHRLLYLKRDYEGPSWTDRVKSGRL